ncbi:GATOR2 complex protein MIOS-like [Littorina saxatilis]|uniref:WD repeat protein mio zinc-ribbon like domain-containing protein n=1 Tax=Littorina saxatilis TaxID=31220 RepID=A0AAN9GIR2_9CAEN
MSRVEVLWSPTEDNTFITYGSAINLYQVDGPENSHFSKHPESSLKVADQKYAVHCATNSEIHFIKCAAWYPKPEPKNLLAVGQANGRVVLTSFGDPGDDELIGKEFVPRHSRQCNYLAWNPVESNFLAEGLEKFRNDSCVVIWDVNMSHSISETSERSRYSSSEHGSITRPYAEIGAQDTSSSFAWFDGRNFVCGMNNRYLRLYDLRDPAKPRLSTQHRTVYGVCVDNQNSHRLASFGESQVAVWDTRSFDRPVFTLQEAKPVSKISWCLTRSGVLTVMCKDSPILRLYDIRHAVIGCDDIEPVIIDRNIQPCGEHVMSSFAWHPKDENRLLAAAGPSCIKDIVVFERIPVAWSPNSSLTWANGKRTMSCVDSGQLNAQDISTRMRHRALSGYGMQCEDMQANAIVVADEPNLLALWKWISLVRQPQFQRPNQQGKRGAVYNMGIKQILKFYNEQSNPMVSELAYVNWQATEGVTFAIKHQYRSAERSLALSLCGWVQDTHPDFNNHLNALVDNGEEEKAAAIAIFFLKMKKALEILSASATTDNGKLNLNAVAMALAGYNENSNHLWRQTCASQRSQLADPYLRAIFGFLASDSDYYEDVLNEEGLSVEDRVAFALTYLPDTQLRDRINRLADDLVCKGDLDGMLLTGMSNEGVDLLECYVDRTSDVQTAAVTAVFSGTAQTMSDERVTTWINSYRTLLDQWALWHERCKFDIVSQSCEPSVPHPPQVYINCNFCGKSITSNRTSFRLADRFMQLNPFSRSPQQQRQKITCCPSCRKALPRCAVCLGTLGTASAFSANVEQPTLKSGQQKLTLLQDWFAWCQTCRHGGHAAHLTDWFRDHCDCPVTGCMCKCMTIDSTDVHPASS